jgi:hypothetical protein
MLSQQVSSQWCALTDLPTLVSEFENRVDAACVKLETSSDVVLKERRVFPVRTLPVLHNVISLHCRDYFMSPYWSDNRATLDGQYFIDILDTELPIHQAMDFSLEHFYKVVDPRDQVINFSLFIFFTVYFRFIRMKSLKLLNLAPRSARWTLFYIYLCLSL